MKLNIGKTAAGVAGAGVAVGATTFAVSSMGDEGGADDIVEIDGIVETTDAVTEASVSATGTDTAAAAATVAAAAAEAEVDSHFQDWGEDYLASDDNQPAPEDNDLAYAEGEGHDYDDIAVEHEPAPEDNLMADADGANVLPEIEVTPWSGTDEDDLAATDATPEDNDMAAADPTDDYDNLMADLGIQGDDDLMTLGDEEPELAAAEPAAAQPADAEPEAIPMGNVGTGFQAAAADDLAAATINVDLDAQPLDIPASPVADIQIDTDADNLMASVEADVDNLIGGLADEGLVASTQGTLHQEIDETDTLSEGLIQFDEMHTMTGANGQEMTVATAHYSDDGMPVMVADTTGDGSFDSYVDAAGNILGSVNSHLTTDDAQVQIYGDDDYIAGAQFDVDSDLEHLTAMTNTEFDTDFDPTADLIDTASDMV